MSSLAQVLRDGDFIRKTADETVNNSAAMQNDDELLFAIAANETVFFDFLLLWTSPAAADLDLDWTIPAGASLIWNIGNNIGANIHSAPFMIISDGFKRGLTFKGVARAGATAGTCQMRWAQTVATVGNTTIHLDSYLSLWRR